MQGWRVKMEDAHICYQITLPSGETAMIFGVFDGHGGPEVAQYVAKHFLRTLTS